MEGRLERIFDHKLRTIGIDKDALDKQVNEKKKLEEEEEQEQKLYEDHIHRICKTACILQRRQEKRQQALGLALADYWHENQQPWTAREFDLNDPDRFKKISEKDAQMLLPGLVGEDPEKEERLQRQREQSRDWLLQQQGERAAEKNQQVLDDQEFSHMRIEADQRAVQLQEQEQEMKRDRAIATREFNQKRSEESRRKKQEEFEQEQRDTNPNPGRLAPPGIIPCNDRRAVPECPQWIVRYQKYQTEEKKLLELEEKQRNERYDLIQLSADRAALLIERKQARLKKKLRQDLERENMYLAEIRQQLKPDLERGEIEESFFSKFNTCYR